MNVKKVGNKLEYDFRINGKRYRDKGNTRREAVHAGNIRYNELAQGRDLKAKIIFHQRFIDYHDKYTKPNVSEKTYSNYDRLYKTLIREFGYRDIKDITKDDYQDFINKLADQYVIDGVNRYNSYIRAVVRDAINEGLATRDFTLNVRIFSNVKSKEEKHMYLDLQELKAIKKYYMDRKDHMAASTYLILLMIATGGRFSDCINLKRNHIDEVKGTVYLDGTKNINAKRTVNVDKETIKLLLQYADDRPAHMSGYLFTHRGRQIKNSAVNESIKKACEAVGIKRNITSHALRHTHISILIYEGVDIAYIADRVGHSSPDITYREYAHLIKESKDKQSSKTLSVLEEL